MASKIIVCNTLHGNAPAIMAAYLAKEVAAASGLKDTAIIIPNLYPGSHERILAGRFGQAPSIFLDSGLGRIVNQIMFERQDFAGHLEQVIEYHADVKRQAQTHLAGRFSAQSLAGELREFGGRDIAMELNLGSEVSFGIQPNAYAFCFLNSDIRRAAIDEGGLGFDIDKLKRNEELLLREEEGYGSVTICLPNTFTGSAHQPRYKTDSSKKVIEVPPLMRAMPTTQEDVNPAIYLSLSGTHSAERPLIENAGQIAAQEGLKVYAAPWVKDALGYELRNPGILGHPNIKAVVHRGGLGTCWEAIRHGKPQILVPYQPNDDPENYFDLVMYEAMGLGVVYRGQPDILSQALALAPRIGQMRSELIGRFGSLDGFAASAPRIATALR